MFDDLNQMFAQAGLRFDQDFLNRVFFSGKGIMFQFFTAPGRDINKTYGGNKSDPNYSQTASYQPNFIERWLSKIATKIGKFMLGKLFGFQYEPLPGNDLDYHMELAIFPAEAVSGCEKPVNRKQDNGTKKLLVKIPPRVKPGTKIRLKGMGITTGNKSGDLYLHIKIKG